VWRDSDAGHTDWCARGTRCGLGEHRSEPTRLTAPYGGLVLTGVRGRNGRDYLEVVGSVYIDGWEQADQLAAALDLAIRAVKTGDVEALQPMIDAAGPAPTRGRWWT
jgi:hypothetical protein